MKPEERKESKEQDDLSLRDIGPFVIRMNRLLADLWRDADRLPIVDQSGYCECPFGENLYARKNEDIDKVERESEKARRFLELVEGEIARCRQNIDQISADTSCLNLDEANEKYADGKRAQESQYDRAIQQREMLEDLISRTEKTLGLARSKQFPGRVPQRSNRPSGVSGQRIALGASTPGIAPPAAGPLSSTEVDSLISLGPLGKKNS